MANELTKTGEVYWRDENDQRWLSESYVDEKGVVTT